MASIWSNWAGNQRALVDVLRPTTEHELCEVVRRAAADGRHLKALGAGHSFSDAALSDGVLLGLDDYGRVLDLDADAGLVTVQAGARLGALSQYLGSRGLALENPIGVPGLTVAGAVSTATHGTGAGFRGLASEVVAMRIVGGGGEVAVIDDESDPEMLPVATVGVGALGIISTVTLRVVPAFNLEVVEEEVGLAHALDAFATMVVETDHFGFSWVTGTHRATTTSARRNNDERRDRAGRPGWLGAGLDRTMRRADTKVFNEPSFAASVSARPSGLCAKKHLEMEYAVPLEAAIEAFKAVRGCVAGGRGAHRVEVRTAASDRLALSPAAGRDTGYISVSVPGRTPAERLFHAVEDVMSDHGGRPHWGKIHFRSAEDLAPLYPRWEDFCDLRRRLDPAGVFENAYTRRCFGPVAG